MASFQFYTTSLDTVLSEFIKPDFDNTLAILLSKRFVNSFRTLRSGIAAYLQSQTPKNRAKAEGAVTTFLSFLKANSFDTLLIMANPFETQPTVLRTVLQIIYDISPADLNSSRRGAYYMSTITNSVLLASGMF